MSLHEKIVFTFILAWLVVEAAAHLHSYYSVRKLMRAAERGHRAPAESELCQATEPRLDEIKERIMSCLDHPNAAEMSPTALLEALIAERDHWKRLASEARVPYRTSESTYCFDCDSAPLACCRRCAGEAVR